MLFHHKKETKSISPEEIQKFTSKGMSDKEIIKHFKSKGYSYDDIEKAMMSAVKNNIGEKSPVQMSMPEPEPFYYDQPYEQETMQEIQEEWAEPADSMVEEIVEGIIEDKWQKFQAQIDNLQMSIDRLSAEIKQVKTMPIQSTKEPIFDNARIDEINEHVNDLYARVGGLEKAFKQFLPSLTRNIEMLSSMVHEMKNKTEITV